MFTFSSHTRSGRTSGSPAESESRQRATQRPRCHGRVGDGDALRRPRAVRPVDARRSCVVERRPSEAVYRRRRRVVGVLAAVFVAVGIVAAHDVLAGPGGVPASAAVGLPAPEAVVTARPGDTLWGIAERHHGEVPISRYVDALIDLNGGASIEAGQAVRLP